VEEGVEVGVLDGLVEFKRGGLKGAEIALR